jgi:hypothetical protein
MRSWEQALFIILQEFFLRCSAHGRVSAHTAAYLFGLFCEMLTSLSVIKYMYDHRFRHLTVIAASVGALALALVLRDKDARQKAQRPMGFRCLRACWAPQSDFFGAIPLPHSKG